VFVRVGTRPEESDAGKGAEARHAGEVERISSGLLEALQVSGYVKPIAVVPTEERVRRLVRRLELSSRDAELVLGMLRQILWKLRGGMQKT